MEILICNPDRCRMYVHNLEDIDDNITVSFSGFNPGVLSLWRPITSQRCCWQVTPQTTFRYIGVIFLFICAWVNSLLIHGATLNLFTYTISSMEYVEGVSISVPINLNFKILHVPFTTCVKHTVPLGWRVLSDWKYSHALNYFW